MFYRASTQSKARELGLTGWVRNCPDGSVELQASGDPEVLRQLEDWLWRGPERARVETVEVTPVAARSDSGFTVRRD